MKLRRKNTFMPDEYKCEVTDFLDQLSGLDKRDSVFKHYVLFGPTYGDELPIRVPGGTVGVIHIQNNTITKIKVATDYVVRTYPNDVNEQLQQFVGQPVEV